ncbi:MAG: site-specific integrase [Methylicorpusculum sp.]|uniref:tyrosine-type recombinase/integrase n=1 Tax=Methylicorpusculum sp. TaxID=2713644 RepID=UPI00272F5066|nr:site-specific integrase [Methylicorpusculum sp.]MDP2201766.1 site-specific integrase [Methylicorpusculum sp.]
MLNFHIIKVDLKNGETRYRTILTKSGKGIKTKTFRRKQDARTWGTRSVLEHQEYEAKGVRPCTISFDRLADEYMVWWSGKDHDRARLVKWWVDQFGKTLISEITPDEIRLNLKTKRAQAPATYNRYLAVLSSIMDFATRQQEDDAVLEQYIDENPCKRVRSQTVNNKVVHYLSDEEKPRLLKAAKEIGGKFYLKVLMALTTGMRKGELDQLRWNDIDFDKGLAMLSDTKNGSPRYAPIPGVIMDELKKHRKVGSCLLFPSTVDPNKPFEYKKQWANCLKAANIKNFRWHDMRHDTASTLARDGRTLKEIAEILGHKCLASTDRYTHLSTAHKSQVLNETMSKAISLIL